MMQEEAQGIARDLVQKCKLQEDEIKNLKVTGCGDDNDCQYE